MQGAPDASFHHWAAMLPRAVVPQITIDRRADWKWFDDERVGIPPG